MPLTKYGRPCRPERSARRPYGNVLGNKNKKMEYKKIRDLIAEGNVLEAIETLRTKFEGSQILEKNEVIHQSSRLNNILKEKRIGLLSEEDCNLAINQVTTGILTLIDNLEKKYPDTQKVEDNSGNTILGVNDSVELRFFYYISRLKIEMLSNQISTSLPSTQDIISKTSALLNVLEKQNHLISLADVKNFEVSKMYIKDKNEWNHGLYGFYAAGQEVVSYYFYGEKLAQHFSY
jgi:hypothetical protein